MAHGRKTGGRKAGTPNKATSDARIAISEIVDGHTHKLTEWIDTVAEGIHKTDPSTGKTTDEYLIRPNPAKAFDMFHSLLEFHVPKLTRVQVDTNDQDTNLKNFNLGVFSEIIQDIKLGRQAENQGLPNHRIK
jgi:hypothetical protein